MGSVQNDGFASRNRCHFASITCHGATKVQKLDEGDVNGWILNQALAPNPFVRYLTSMMYLSDVTGLAKINYPDSDFMKSIKFENLFEKRAGDKDETERSLSFFTMPGILISGSLHYFPISEFKDKAYRGAPINASDYVRVFGSSFIEQTVEIGGDTYCEGALVDTVNFEACSRSTRNELDEIWVSRIVDSQQVRKPKNLH